MRGRRRSESDLGEADRRFRQWRRDRVFPGRIPHELWRLAAAAACVHGLQRTAERLQVDAARLEAWMGKLGEGGRSAEPASARPFVELPPLDVFGAGDCTLELEEPSGRTLRIILRGPATAQAMELGQMLRGSSP